MSTWHSLFDRLMSPGQITTLFQPIFRVDQDRLDVFALEALSRGPAGTNVERADVLFEYVRRKRKEDVLDVACFDHALKHSMALPPFGRLFFNVHASTLAKGPGFVDNIEAICVDSEVSPTHLVLEVVEHTPYWNSHEFLTSTRRLREMGVRIAVDDLGVAYSSFKMILDIGPDYFKIDSYITHDCHRDRIRRSMVESFVSLARTAGAALIAEGVETKSDMEELRSLGIDLFQGYLLAQPQPVWQLALSLEDFRSAWFAAEVLQRCHSVSSGDWRLRNSGICNKSRQ
jgi:EAL domain-containing protein (putative c-di-GMP-specific phosphodiesterase class I)